jgi:hypothetical protein
MKKLSLFLVFMSLLVAFQIKKGDRVDVNINANGDFNVSEGNFTVEKGYINSVNSGAYIKIKPKDINSSYALMVGGDVWIDGTIYYNEPILSIESSKTIKETNDDQTLQIKVKLSYAISKDVTFKVKTYDGSGDDGAVAGEDYDSIDDKYTIKAGDTETTINVTIKGDDLYEYDDKFKVEISDVQNAQLGNDTCDVTIENDDEKPTISVKEDVSAKEDVDPDFEVDLSKKAGVPVTFHIKMTHDTTDDDDFEGDSPIDADFTIKKGDTSAKITVDVYDDDTDEDDEDYYFEITAADNATIDDDNKKKKGTIEDNDSSGWGFSDKELKKNIKELNNALEKLSKIRGVEFYWKKKGWSKRKQFGVIAQELQKVYPEMVIKKHGYLRVNYQALIAPLIESVKELKKENEKLKKEIQTIKNEIKKLKEAK